MSFMFVRPKASSQPSLRCLRWRSSIHACQSGRFSIIARPSTPKETVLERIEESGLDASAKRPKRVRPEDSDAAVILASQDFASWLEDSSFVSSLLRRCSFNASGAGTSGNREVAVLGAVVDSLCPLQPQGTPTSGLSILHGKRDAILPGLWQGGSSSGGNASRHWIDAQASVSVALSPFLGDARALTVTVPLANTVFQNGRRSTLLASRWRSEGGSNAPYELAYVAWKETQLIVPSLRSIQKYTSVSVPLLAVTAPRKIVAGLGNIVRQVEVDGKPVPASKELESEIPSLLQARYKQSAGVAAGPISVWALVMPPDVVESGLLGDVTPARDHDARSEHAVADKTARSFASLLAAGCRLHKILSGGGGWGLKQGLLSLDPQTAHSPPGEHDDMERFIRSFKGESNSGDTITPGSYVQFFVEPVRSSDDPAAATDADKVGCESHSPSLLFGVHPGGSGHETRQDAGGEPVVVIEDHFGAVSGEGLFISSMPPAEGSSSEAVEGGGKGQTVRTKIDVPYSYVWEGAKRWL